MKIEKIINKALFEIALNGRDYGRLDITKSFLCVASISEKNKETIASYLEENGINSEKELLQAVGIDKLNFENKYSSIFSDVIDYYCNLLIAKIDKRIDRMGNDARLSKREWKELIFII